MRTVKRTILAGVIWTVLLGCSDEDENVFSKNGNTESKPVVTDSPGSADLSKKAAKVAEVTYDLSVTSSSGAVPCRGEVALGILEDFSLDIPTAVMNCGSLTLNLGMVLGKSVMSGGEDRDLTGNMQHDGKVMSMKQIANANFYPERPILLGPIIQNPSDYVGFKRTTEHKLETLDKTTGKRKESRGEFKVTVLDVESHFEVPGGSFDNVLHWQLEANGFDGIPKSQGLMFSKWEWYWNTRPIMIPKIVIVGELSDFIQSKNGESGTNDLLGELKIELIAKQYNM